MTLYGALPLGVVVGLAVVLGLAAGSFVNVVAHRVPAGLSVASPGSACPACGHAVRGFDNVPVLSWLVLRGRCRDCASPISARYPVVEAGTGLLFGVLAIRLADLRGAPGWSLLAAAAVLAAAGVALALIDLDHGRLPFVLTGMTAALTGLALAAGWAWTGSRSGAEAVLDQAVPVLVGAGIWLAVIGGLHVLTRGRGMGLGDVALAPVLGGFLGAFGVAEAAVGLGLAFALGSLLGAVALALQRGAGAGRGTRIPFGPFLLAGTLGGVLVGGVLADAYLRLVGLA
ncbi:prepilin peptidase [Nocardioides dongkuii]|uniref:prepilin peptidase n=1 Tax=Nocardioides dongkuii TaxID=2760089 RepID=UPI001FD4F7B5|nr:A24 family peptidase [Nocardioides dongkuii]